MNKSEIFYCPVCDCNGIETRLEECRPATAAWCPVCELRLNFRHDVKNVKYGALPFLCRRTNLDWSLDVICPPWAGLVRSEVIQENQNSLVNY